MLENILDDSSSLVGRRHWISNILFSLRWFKLIRPTKLNCLFVLHTKLKKSARGWIYFLFFNICFCKVAFWGHFSANNTELYVRNTEWNEKRLNKLKLDRISKFITITLQLSIGIPWEVNKIYYDQSPLSSWKSHIHDISRMLCNGFNQLLETAIKFSTYNLIN